MAKQFARFVLTAAALAAATAATAQIRPVYQFPPLPSADGPANVQIGTTPFFIAPFASFGVGRDDNVLLTEADEIDSTFYQLSPGFNIDARGRNQVLQLAYRADIVRYQDSEEDNFVDHNLRSQYDIAFDRRNFLRLGVDYLRGHEARGSTDRGIRERPDRFRLTSPNITYAFGAPGARGRIEAYYSHGDRRYLNNRETTAAFDRKSHEGGGAFYVRAGTRTYFLAEARLTDIKYRELNIAGDSEERRYFGGISWEPTALTSGTFKVGRFEKRFDSGLPSYSDTAWEASVTWAPRTYSKVDFFTSRTAYESTGLGSFIVSDIYGGSWAHAWNSRLSTTLSARFQDDDYQGFDRTDETTVLGFRVDYRFRRWLTVGAEYVHTRRDSNRPTFDYDKNLYLITATATM